MRLVDIAALGLEVLRDGEFRSLGLLSHRQDQMLVMLYDEAYLGHVLENSAVSAVVTTPKLAERLPGRLGIGVCADPMFVFYRIHNHLRLNTDFYGISFDTVIDPTATVSERAFVSPRNVRIGARCVIEPSAIVLEGSVLDEEVVIRAGTIVGGEGFEPKLVGGHFINIRHAGGVHLAKGVEVLGNSHVAKDVFGGYTEVGADTKIDANVHIAHHVVIGQQCEIAAGVVIAGSTSIGDKVWIGPGAVISSEVTIGQGAFIALGAVVTKNIPSGWKVFGIPARRLPPMTHE